MIDYHGGHACTLTLPGPELGYQVHKASEGVAGTWWRGPWPSSPGVAPIPAGCTVWAYRAINLNPFGWWPGGPTNYAQSLVNLVNPGVNDLTAPAGAPAWAAATGWQFVAAQARYLNTGVTPLALTWSAFVQFDGADTTLTSRYFGSNAIGARFYTGVKTTNVVYANGNFIVVAPPHAAGNEGFADRAAYRDGANDGAIGLAGVPPWPMYIGAINTLGAATLYCTANIAALLVTNCTVTPAQALALATAMGEL